MPKMLIGTLNWCILNRTVVVHVLLGCLEVMVLSLFLILMVICTCMRR